MNPGANLTDVQDNRKLRFSPDDLELFSSASHDRNPLHMSADYARKTSYGDRIVFGSTALVAMRTPGHTDESTTYRLDDTAALTGDTLFLNSVGRPDLAPQHR